MCDKCELGEAEYEEKQGLNTASSPDIEKAKAEQIAATETMAKAMKVARAQQMAAEAIALVSEHVNTWKAVHDIGFKALVEIAQFGGSYDGYYGYLSVEEEADGHYALGALQVQEVLYAAAGYRWSITDHKWHKDGGVGHSETEGTWEPKKTN